MFFGGMQGELWIQPGKPASQASLRCQGDAFRASRHDVTAIPTAEPVALPAMLISRHGHSLQLEIAEHATEPLEQHMLTAQRLRRAGYTVRRSRRQRSQTAP